MPPSPSRSASASALAILDKVAARTPDGVVLFDNLSLTFGPERTGVVGRNGAGKSALLRLIAGAQAPAEGGVVRLGAIGMLEQRHEGVPGETAAETLGVARGLARIGRILAGEADETDLAEADWTLETRVGEMLDQVGLPGLALDRPTAGLSGGERTRLRLAGLLLTKPDLILLDEPTNHLDEAGRRRVAKVLDAWEGGAVVVSHDRDLLRRMDRIVEISSLGVETFGGNYDAYAERKAADREAAERGLGEARRAVAKASEETRRRAEARARRDAAGRRKAGRGDMPKILLGARAEQAENSGGRDHALALRRTAEAETALEAARSRMERVRTLSISMPPTGLPAGRAVLALRDVEWSAADGRRIPGPVSLSLVGPRRLAVSGPNGAGKTTLLRLMSGELEPTGGAIDRSVPAVLLDQDAALLRPEETLMEAWRRLNPAGSPNDAHAALARFLFRDAAAHRRAGELSGGERLRAALACVMTGPAPARFLILDEPTNHLDLDSVAAIEAALEGYDGALAVVSHDRDFLKAIGVDETIALGT